MKRTLIAVAAALVISASAWAQASISPSDSIPTVDGAVADGEYQFATTDAGMTLGATLGKDGVLYLSIHAETGGWVALGVGGLKMNGSRLFLAYDAGGKNLVSEQMGAGHFHVDAKDSIIQKSAVKQSQGVTTLELALSAKDAIADGQLSLLYAYSSSTSFMVHHNARGSMTIAVAQ